jgi:Zn-finger in ubiquitin-hydrolases and other protein
MALGDSWPELRMCLQCGHVGCCDKSKNKHAREHFRQSGHPLTQPYKERGMNWVWCYVNEALSIRSDRHPFAEAYFGSPWNWCTGQVAGSTQVTGITELRAHPGRMLVRSERRSLSPSQGSSIS